MFQTVVFILLMPNSALKHYIRSNISKAVIVVVVFHTSLDVVCFDKQKDANISVTIKTIRSKNFEMISL